MEASVNLTDDAELFTYKYDAFGRLRQVYSKKACTPLVAEYRYNGLGFRIADHTDVTRSGPPWRIGPDCTVDSNDPWYFSCYDESWREVTVFRGSDTNPKSWEIYQPRDLAGSAAPAKGRLVNSA